MLNDPVTVVAVLATVVAFAGGVLVAWLRWGLDLWGTRLSREDALAMVQSRVERDVAAKEAEIARLRSLPGTQGMA